MNRLWLSGRPLRRAWWATTWRAARYLLAYQLVGWLLFAAVLTAATAAANEVPSLAGATLRCRVTRHRG